VIKVLHRGNSLISSPTLKLTSLHIQPSCTNSAFEAMKQADMSLICPPKTFNALLPRSLAHKKRRYASYAVMPNPSINRTCPGKPGHAVYLKR